MLKTSSSESQEMAEALHSDLREENSMQDRENMSDADTEPGQINLEIQESEEIQMEISAKSTVFPNPVEIDDDNNVGMEQKIEDITAPALVSLSSTTISNITSYGEPLSITTLTKVDMSEDNIRLTMDEVENDESQKSLEEQNDPLFSENRDSVDTNQEDKLEKQQAETKENNNDDQNNDDDNDSVCVIDSSSNNSSNGKDSEDSDDEDDDDDDDEDEGEDEEDEEDDDTYNDKNEAQNKVKNVFKFEDRRVGYYEDDEEDEEECDDRLDYFGNARVVNNDEYEGDDIYADDFDGGSDDLVLKNNRHLMKNHLAEKGRSQSLHDVSDTSPKKTKSINPYCQRKRLERYHGKRTSLKHSDYEKRNNDNFSEYRKMSSEKRQQAHDLLRNKINIESCDEDEDEDEDEVEEEIEDGERPMAVENGDVEKISLSSVENLKTCNKIESDARYSKQDNDEIKSNYTDEREIKRKNESSNERKGLKRSTEDILEQEDSKKHESYKNEKLTYYEYMKSAESAVNTPQNSNSVNAAYNVESYQNDEMNVDSEKDGFHSEEYDALRRELEHRNSQYDKLREIYQQIMQENIVFKTEQQNIQRLYDENMSLKMEIENSKRVIEKYRKPSPELQKLHEENNSLKAEIDNLNAILSRYKFKELKAIATQTDNELLSNQNINNAEKHQSQTLASAGSSQFSDSMPSLIISQDPSAMTNIHSNDLSKNKKLKSPASRAILTTSKILKALSNITQRSKSIGNSKPRKSAGPEILEISIEDGECVSVLSEKYQDAEDQSNSKKRKANDIAEISSNAQPFKIPHIDSSNWEKIKSPINTPETAMQKTFLQNSSSNNVSSGNESENYNKNQGPKKEEDKVKVFIYPEDESGRENGFLIQAKDIDCGNSKNSHQEYGPFDLGSIEVFLSEVNGTINIWGKEIGHKNSAQNIDDLDVTNKSKFSKAPGFDHQSTPRQHYNIYPSSSMGKNSKTIPCVHESRNVYPSVTLRNNAECEKYDSCCHQTSQKRAVCNSRTSCKHSTEYENQCQHSGHRRHSLPLEDLSQHPCQYDHGSDKRNSMHKHSFHEMDDKSENEMELSFLKHSNMNEHSHSCTKKLSSSCINLRTCETSPIHHNPYDDEDILLMNARGDLKLDDLQHKRSSGRKVRGLLMNILKGCGDCRISPRAAKNLTTTDSLYRPSSSHHQPRMATCSSEEPCNNRQTENCQKGDKAVELEYQLEHFREEMEKLKNQSDSLRAMLNALRGSESN